jgi:glycine betaine/proline transport system substrate-binding protein
MAFNLRLPNSLTPAARNLKGWGTAAVLTTALVGLAACGGGDTATTEEGGDDTAAETADGDMPGEGVSVTAGYAVLEERFQTEIVNIGLERLGYEIDDPKELEYATLHVDIGNGGIDYTSAHWEQLHQEFFENSGGDDALERTGTYIANVLQGYKIDQATAEEYGITSLEQLQDPEIAALFDTDGDGKANLTGCNPAGAASW